MAETRAPPTPLTETLPFKAGARAHPAPPFGCARGGRGAGSAGSARAGAGRRRGRREPGRGRRGGAGGARARAGRCWAAAAAAAAVTMAESAGASSFFPLVVLLLAGSGGSGPRGIQGESRGGGGGRDGEGRARARPRAAAPGYSAPPPHAHNMAGRGARGSRGDPQSAFPDPGGAAAQLGPSSRRSPGDPSPLPGGTRFEELSGVALPVPPCSIMGSAGYLPQDLEIHVSAPQYVQGRGSPFPPSRCSWGAPFLPPRLWGSGSGVFGSPRDPGVEKPRAPRMKGVAVSNPSFRPCTWGASNPPSRSSLIFWESESHFPFAQSLEFSGATPPQYTCPAEALWRKWDE